MLAHRRLPGGSYGAGLQRLPGSASAPLIRRPEAPPEAPPGGGHKLPQRLS